jgi:hypothetical protein
VAVPAVSATVASAPTVSTWYETTMVSPADLTSKIAPDTATVVSESRLPAGSPYVLTILFCTTEPAGCGPALTTKNRSVPTNSMSLSRAGTTTGGAGGLRCAAPASVASSRMARTASGLR